MQGRVRMHLGSGGTGPDLLAALENGEDGVARGNGLSWPHRPVWTCHGQVPFPGADDDALHPAGDSQLAVPCVGATRHP